MKILGDYHTHTPYSHGKGTVLENALIAKQKGLKEIAITDHSAGHRLFGIDRIQMPKQRLEIEQAKKETGLNILYGQEFNLIGLNGETDILPEDEQTMNIVLMGFHYTAKPFSLKDKFNLFWKNNFAKIFGVSKKLIQQNTDAYIKAIEKYNIDVITHPNYGILVDIVQIAEVANKKGTLIELNGKRCIFKPEEIKKMIEMKTKFIINSDAHTKERVGECNDGFNCAIKNQIPKELIVNIEHLPKFKNHKG